MIQLNCADCKGQSLPTGYMMTLTGLTGGSQRIIATLQGNQRACREIDELIINDKTVAEKINIDAIHKGSNATVLEISFNE